MMADTLVTPLNDSFVDFDVLCTLDTINYTVTGESHYAEMVREARRQRRLVDGKLTDWIVVRNRPPSLGSRNRKLVGDRAAARAEWLSVMDQPLQVHDIIG
jgi:chromosome partitioning protein